MLQTQSIKASVQESRIKVQTNSEKTSPRIQCTEARQSHKKKKKDSK